MVADGGDDAGGIALVACLADLNGLEFDEELAEVGAEALVETLALFEGGVVEEIEQDDDLATYAPKVGREAARIDWESGARAVGNLIRGMDAVPGAWSELEEMAVKLFRPTPDREVDHKAPPGTVLTADVREGLLVAAGVGAVRIDQVQPAGHHQMIWNAESVPSGVYFYKIQAGKDSETRKMMLLK